MTRIVAVAKAMQSLSRFNLDLAGDSVGGVTVDGLRARSARDGEDIVITPPFPLLEGLPFVVSGPGARQR